MSTIRIATMTRRHEGGQGGGAGATDVVADEASETLAQGESYGRGNDWDEIPKPIFRLTASEHGGEA